MTEVARFAELNAMDELRALCADSLVGELAPEAASRLRSIVRLLDAASPKKKSKVRASKRLRLTTAGELRALWRLCPETTPEIRRLMGVVMAELDTAEVIEARVTIEDAGQITLDEDTSRVIRAFSWGRLEKALVEANAAYNQDDWSSAHEQAKELLWASDELQKHASVIYSLTPLNDDDLRADDAE